MVYLFVQLQKDYARVLKQVLVYVGDTAHLMGIVYYQLNRYTDDARYSCSQTVIHKTAWFRQTKLT